MLAAAAAILVVALAAPSSTSAAPSGPGGRHHVAHLVVSREVIVLPTFIAVSCCGRAVRMDAAPSWTECAPGLALVPAAPSGLRDDLRVPAPSRSGRIR
jgi:hypothetical protein